MVERIAQIAGLTPRSADSTANRYFTFLLCFKDRVESQVTVALVDRLTGWLSRRTRLSVIADMMTDSPRSKPTLTGFFEDCRPEIVARQIKTLRIGPYDWHPSRPASIYFYLKNEHLTGDTFMVSGLKLLTISIGKNIWDARGGADTDFRSSLEEFFVTQGGHYGFGHERQFMISGPFDRLEEKFEGSPLRVCDIDYRERIPGIYRYNYFSPQLLRHISGVESLGEINGITCRRFGDGVAAQESLVLEVERFEPNVIAQLTSRLGPLLQAG